MQVFFEYHELLDIDKDDVSMLVENAIKEDKIVHWVNIKRDK
jgi:hypothetical protein